LELLDAAFKPTTSDTAAVRVNVDPGHLRAALNDPLRTFLSRPGKEFRARLCELSWGLAGGHGPLPQQLANIVEVLHAGSLIVDDIEDESATRRGLPALHVSHGVAVALNAGNWLYFWAYSLVEALDLGPHVKLNLYRWLSRTMVRCHEGQALDLTVRMGKLAQNEVQGVVETTTRLKTGALMGLAAVIPTLATGASNEVARAFQSFGESLGVGLQMLDDLGGLTSERRCHKGHEDLIHGRPSWPWAWLAGELDEISYLRLQQQAREVEARDLHPEHLAEEMRRRLGPTAKRRVFSHLARTLRLLPANLPGAAGIPELQQELTRLMRSYD
jgi:geranylgeranyl pyrophosphate synthase